MFRQNDPSTADARATLPDAADPPHVKAFRALEAGCGMGDPAVDGAVRECCEERKLLMAAFERAVAAKQDQQGRTGGFGEEQSGAGVENYRRPQHQQA